MKNKIKSVLNNKYTNYILIIIVSLLISIPFLKISLLGTGDTTLHLLRIIGLKNSIETSTFPYIISPFFCNNFGYATNLFYPQLVTYLPYILKIFTSSYETAMELFAFLTISLSGIFMYNFTNQVSKNKWVSLISSIIYLVFPYRFECIYERFAIGEFTALIFIPILFQGLYNLIKQDKTKNYLISIGAIGLILSHTLTAIYAVIFSIIFILFNIKDFLKKDVIKLCLINVAFIILATALYTFPLLEHKIATNYRIFDAETMRGTGSDVYDDSATLKKLLTDNGSDKTVSFTLGVPIIIFLLMSVIAYKKIEKEDKDWYITFLIIGIISLYMVTRLFPWLKMPTFLTMIQFSWRLLVFFNFFIAPVCAMNIYIIQKRIKNKNVSVFFVIACICLLTVCTSMRLYQFVEEKTPNYDSYKNYESSRLEKRPTSCMSINREYMPNKANNDYVTHRKDCVYILSGTATIENEDKYALNMTFDIKDYKQNTVLELPFLYYLGYDIEMVNNENIITKINYTESDNGFISIKLPEDIDYAKIKIKYTGTVLEKMSYVISTIGFVLLITYIIIFKRRKKHEEK